MIIRDAKGITAEGVYTVDDVYYIDDYATDACNPDFEDSLDAEWTFKDV